MYSKLTKVLLSAAITVPLLALQSFHIYKNSTHGSPSSNNQRSSGIAAAQGQDRTGSPLSNGTCLSCHSTQGSLTNTRTAVLVKNSSNESVNSYLPGEELTIEVTVSAGNSPAGYGSQLTVLDASNKMAGDLVSASSLNTQISTVNDVKYLEHDGISSTGIFTAAYTAPIEGTGTVTLYGIGLAANRSDDSEGDNVSSPVTLSLTEDQETGLEEREFSAKLSAYPNPSNGIYTIDLGSQYSNISTKLCNASGEVIFTTSYQNIKEIQMDIDQSAGIYFLVIETENKTGSIRLVKD